MTVSVYFLFVGRHTLCIFVTHGTHPKNDFWYDLTPWHEEDESSISSAELVELARGCGDNYFYPVNICCESVNSDVGPIGMHNMLKDR